MQLKNKSILLISPQAWGTMLLSKHHYAITLARLGNKVFFLNPPSNKIKKGEIRITPSEQDNLFIIEHAIMFPFILKFHAISVFHWLMKFQVKKLLKSVGRPIDIVWSFDQLNLTLSSMFLFSAA